MMSSKTETTATKEEAKPALVPKLRFPGFSDSWTYEPLSKVLKEHKLKNTEGRDVFSVSMEYGIVNQIELLGRSYAAADTSHYTIGRRYDVVYTKSPLKAFPFGIVKQCKFDGEVALSPLYGVFTPLNAHLGLMIEAYFEAPNRSKDFLSPLCQKGAKNTLQITNTTFLSGRLPLPTQPAEQQKIAECLSSVDELMAAQARKVEALKTHKKGLMQQLFPREGETQPRLRFPEFQNAGEWEVSELGSLSDVRDGTHDSPSFFQTGRPLVTSKNLRPDGTLDLENVSLISEEDYEQINKRSKVSVGDILFGMIGTIGNPVLIKSEGFAIKNVALIKEVGPLSNAFLVQLLQSGYVAAIFAVLNTGNSQKFIALGKIRGLPVPVPSLPEQQRIASCLSSLDALITAETQKHEALKTHKKGLMQQLFPSPEEVAG